MPHNPSQNNGDGIHEGDIQNDQETYHEDVKDFH